MSEKILNITATTPKPTEVIDCILVPAFNGERVPAGNYIYMGPAFLPNDGYGHYLCFKKVDGKPLRAKKVSAKCDHKWFKVTELWDYNTVERPVKCFHCGIEQDNEG